MTVFSTEHILSITRILHWVIFQLAIISHKLQKIGLYDEWQHSHLMIPCTLKYIFLESFFHQKSSHSPSVLCLEDCWIILQFCPQAMATKSLVNTLQFSVGHSNMDDKYINFKGNNFYKLLDAMCIIYIVIVLQ